ncbi:SMU2, partial [Symbiodinium microadriaticum]
MLSNKDFVKILSDGGGGSGGDRDGNGKFDLNQIRQWDQQNRAKEQRKSAKKAAGQKTDKDEEEDATSKKADNYRDRAQERRNDANPDYDAQLEAVANLDVEQTKYLGGDEEHTHLVKGLDYALLRKVRNQTEKNEARDQDSPDQLLESLENIGTRLSRVAAQSQLGDGIKALLLSDKGSFVRAGGRYVKAQDIPRGVKNTALSRTAYEFDTNPLGEAELPTVLRRSKEEAARNSRDDAEDLQSAYILPAGPLGALVEVFKPGEKGSATRRRSRPAEENKSAHQERSVPAPPPPPEPVDIFDDAGKYDPVMSVATAGDRGGPSGGSSYFVATSSVSTGPGEEADGGGEEDLMGSVRQLLQAQAAQEKA